MNTRTLSDFGGLRTALQEFIRTEGSKYIQLEPGERLELSVKIVNSKRVGNQRQGEPTIYTVGDWEKVLSIEWSHRIRWFWNEMRKSGQLSRYHNQDELSYGDVSVINKTFREHFLPFRLYRFAGNSSHFATHKIT